LASGRRYLYRSRRSSSHICPLASLAIRRRRFVSARFPRAVFALSVLGSAGLCWALLGSWLSKHPSPPRFGGPVPSSQLIADRALYLSYNQSPYPTRTSALRRSAPAPTTTATTPASHKGCAPISDQHAPLAWFGHSAARPSCDKRCPAELVVAISQPPTNSDCFHSFACPPAQHPH
jgi:hypothetical protein